MEKIIRFHQPRKRTRTAPPMPSAVRSVAPGQTTAGVTRLFIISAVVFVACAIIARHPAMFDDPLITFANTHFVGSRLFDTIAVQAAQLYTPSGILFMSMVVYCWFSGGVALKARVLNGTVAAILAGMLGRCLQVFYASHPRPLHDPGLNFHLPWAVDPKLLNAWDAFPSDHAAVWFGLATVIAIACPRLGGLAVIWAVATSALRIYLGYHAPSDVIGGAALGILLVSVSQDATLRQASAGLIAWGERHAAPFYAMLFFAGYQVATLFDDIRRLAGAVRGVLR